MTDIIYPESLVSPGTVDDLFVLEAEKNGLPFALLSENGDLVNVDAGKEYLYRGMVLSSEDYRNMAHNVLNRGSSLLISPTEYEKTQFVSGWFPYFERFTPDTIILPFNSSIGTIEQAANSIGYPLIIKNESESLKKFWNEGMFVSCREQLSSVVEFFKDHSDPWAGIVLRKYEDWFNSEWRTWWVNGSLVDIEERSDNKDIKLPITENKDFTVIESIIKSLDTSIVAVDFTVRRSDNKLRVVELGSGAVTEGENIKPLINYAQAF